MKKGGFIVASFFAMTVMASSAALSAGEAPVKLVPVLKINKEYDKRTAIKPSTIPNAGNGLFALAAINKDEVIGELGGRLVAAEEIPSGNHYLASIPECAWEETQPLRYLDSKDFGGNVSRINFAPSHINGVETYFQNAAIRQLCEYPYFVFIALQDIAPGTEIWASYGARYDYEKFMYAPEVRDFFCGLINLDCRREYSFEH